MTIQGRTRYMIDVVYAVCKTGRAGTDWIAAEALFGSLVHLLDLHEAEGVAQQSSSSTLDRGLLLKELRIANDHL